MPAIDQSCIAVLSQQIVSNFHWHRGNERKEARMKIKSAMIELEVYV